MELSPFFLPIGLLAGLAAGRRGWLSLPVAVAAWIAFWIKSGGDPYGDGTVSPAFWLVGMTLSAFFAAVGVLIGMEGHRGLERWRRRSG